MVVGGGHRLKERKILGAATLILARNILLVEQYIVVEIC